MLKLLLLTLLPLLAPPASAQTRTRDVIYTKKGGAAFTMDVLQPAKPNKAAVVFLISGGWMSDHAMVKAYEPDVERVFVTAGFTVFEVVHGAQPRFKVAEIVEQVGSAVRFVHAHAADYGIDAKRVGITGISSGAHLSLMIAGQPNAPVAAVAAIAPPTDLANWGKPSFLLVDDPAMAMFVPALGLNLDLPKSDVAALVRKLSPITTVNVKFPPTLIVHGDADTIVPLQQARTMDQALADAKVVHELAVVAGGGHDEKTFGIGMTKSLRWFQDELLK
jgi:acetyl esterase/lipase